MNDWVSFEYICNNCYHKFHIKKVDMSAFILTPKVNIPLNGGMKIEKGQTFIVNLPFGHLPFDSIDSKNRVTKMLELQGFDVRGHEGVLSSAYFDFKKI